MLEADGAQGTDVWGELKKSSRLSFKIQALKIIVGRGEIQLRKSLHNIIHFHSCVLLGNVSEESEQSMEGQSP